MIYTVDYLIQLSDGSETKVNQQLSQLNLAKMLLNSNVTLLSVNAEKQAYRRKKKVK